MRKSGMRSTIATLALVTLLVARPDCAAAQAGRGDLELINAVVASIDGKAITLQEFRA